MMICIMLNVKNVRNIALLVKTDLNVQHVNLIEHKIHHSVHVMLVIMMMSNYFL